MAFCQGLNSKLKEILNSLTETAEIAVGIGIGIAKGVSTLLQSDIAKKITDFIPGDIDEDIRQKAIAGIDYAIEKLSIVETCKDADDKIQCYLDELKKQSPEFQNSQFFKIASLIASYIHDGTLPEHFYDTYVQVDYVSEKPKI